MRLLQQRMLVRWSSEWLAFSIQLLHEGGLAGWEVTIGLCASGELSMAGMLKHVSLVETIVDRKI